MQGAVLNMRYRRQEGEEHPLLSPPPSRPSLSPGPVFPPSFYLSYSPSSLERSLGYWSSTARPPSWWSMTTRLHNG